MQYVYCIVVCTFLVQYMNYLYLSGTINYKAQPSPPWGFQSIRCILVQYIIIVSSKILTKLCVCTMRYVKGYIRLNKFRYLKVPFRLENPKRYLKTGYFKDPAPPPGVANYIVCYTLLLYLQLVSFFLDQIHTTCNNY